MRALRVIVIIGTNQLLVSYYQRLLCISNTVFRVCAMQQLTPHGGVLA